MAAAWTSTKSSPARMMAALGGLLLLTSLVPSIDWLKEVPTGGLDGRGAGEPPRYLSAWDELGLWSVLVGGAGIVGVAAPWFRNWPGAASGAVIAAGVLTLAISLSNAGTDDAMPLPDQIYYETQLQAGAFVAFAGAALISAGAIISGATARHRSGASSGAMDVR